MATARSLVKTLGVAVVVAVGIYIAASLVLNSASDPCELSLIAERPSPSGKLVARHYLANHCDKQPTPESQVWIGEPKRGLSGSRVFASPYEFTDQSSGQKLRAEIQLTWRGEDLLEIFYPREIFPRDPGHSVNRNGLEVRVDSRYIEVPSNSQMQAGPAQAPAADLKR
jgi:hypothetical protein